MNTTVHSTLLHRDAPKAALAFCRDTLGFEVRNDVGYHGMRLVANATDSDADVPEPLHDR